MSVGLYCVLQLIKNRKTDQWKGNLKHLAYYFGGFILLYGLVVLLFPTPANGVVVYKHHFSSMSLATTWTNISLYGNLVMDVLVSPMVGWGFFGSLLRFGSLLLLLWGLILRLRKGLHAFEIVLLSYLFILLIYPYQQATMRFIFPISPLLFLYFLEAIRFFFHRIPYSWLTKSMIAVFILAQIVIAAKGNYYYSKYSRIPSDLSSDETHATWSYIKNNVSENELILSSYPRLISFYCRRKAYASNPKEGIDVYQQDMEKFNPKYFLISKKYSPAKDYEVARAFNFPLIYENKDYLLFQIKRNE